MNLTFRKFGSGHPLIILHGLYGSGDNWLNIGKNFSGFCEVYLLDQRNHGNSPHNDQHNYEVLTTDLLEFLKQLGIEKTMILGHSMGGKVAMRFAMEFPGMLSKLMIADISPGSYLDSNGNNNHIKVHEKIIDAMMDIDLSKVSGLKDVDTQLAEYLEDDRLRKFLLKNLRKGKEDVYSWKLNLSALRNNIYALSDGLDPERINEIELKSFPVLFIRGEESEYIGDKDRDIIKSIFPLHQMVTLKKAGHWLHAEQPEQFARVIKRFILS